MPEWSWKTTLLTSKLTLTVSIRLKDTLELWRIVLYWKYTTVNCCFVWMSIGSESFLKGSFLHEALIREASFKELFDTKIFSCPFFQGAFFSKFFSECFPWAFFIGTHVLKLFYEYFFRDTFIARLFGESFLGSFSTNVYGAFFPSSLFFHEAFLLRAVFWKLFLGYFFMKPLVPDIYFGSFFSWIH